MAPSVKALPMRAHRPADLAAGPVKAGHLAGAAGASLPEDPEVHPRLPDRVGPSAEVAASAVPVAAVELRD